MSDAGLHHVIYHYGNSRQGVYKRLYGIFSPGNNVGVTEDKTCVTHVYPLELRKEIRSRFADVDSGSHDAEFDTKADTTTVTWQI